MPEKATPARLLGEAELQAVLDALPFAAGLNRGGSVWLCNAALAELFGRPVSAMPGLDVLWLAAEGERERLRDRQRARLEGDAVPRDYAVTALLPSGERVPMRLRASLFPAAGPEVILLALSSERDRMRPTQLIAGFVDAAVAVQQARTTEGIFRIARERLGQLGFSVLFSESTAAGVHYLDAEGPLGWMVSELHQRHRGPVPLAAAPLEQALRESPQGLFVDDLGAVVAQALRRARAEVPVPAGSQAVAAPIQVDGEQAYAAIACASGLDSTVASAFGLFARQLGLAIETTRRLDELAGSNRELMTLNHVARASATLGSTHALQTALERLSSAVPLESAALFRREGGELVLAVHDGLPASWVVSSTRLQLGAALPWCAAAREGQPQPFGAPGLGTGVAVPLQVSDEVLGVLVAARQRVPLSPADQRLLGTVAAQLAISLQNALLFQQTQRRVNELSLLLELGQAVAGSLDPGEVLAAGARVAARVLRCSAAYVFLPADEGHLRCAAAEDPLTRVPRDVRIPLGQPSMTALAFRTGRPQSSHDASVDPRISRELTELFGCRSTLAVPLTAHERPLGVLCLLERSGERTFDAQDLRLASHAAQLLSASVENADLYARERRRAEEMTLLNRELERTQAELIDRERLAALGELSASIAHEVRNPLGVVFNALGSIKRLLRTGTGAPALPAKSGDQVGLLLGIIGEEAERLNGMVGDLLDYSRPLQPALQPVALLPLVEDALESATTRADGAPPAFTQRLQIPQDLTLRADARLLRQALVNLFINAAQAMPRGGRLAVGAERVQVAGAQRARVLIQDSGSGVPQEVRARIFQPFFTTKATGTGLGLAVVKRIVEGHGGRIALRDTPPGEGAAFELWLPVEP